MMEYGPAIMMLVFAGALLLYAALLAITKDYDLLPRRATSPVRPKNSRKYTFQLEAHHCSSDSGLQAFQVFPVKLNQPAFEFFRIHAP